MQKHSAGILMYRIREGCCQVLLGHPGGPLYAGLDEGHWSIPKGQVESGETLLAAAIREFTEETGLTPAVKQPLILGSTPGGCRTIHIWAVRGDCDTAPPPQSNLFSMEWPPGSGTVKEYPEFDRIAFFPLEAAQWKIEPAQAVFLDRLAAGILSRGRAGLSA